MSQIDARSKSIRELLNGVKYAIDYYQREYTGNLVVLIMTYIIFGWYGVFGYAVYAYLKKYQYKAVKKQKVL